MRLKEKADGVDLCKGEDCVDTQLKHAIAVGLKDEEIVQQLFRLKSDMPLDEVLKTVRSWEAARKTTHVIKGTTSCQMPMASANAVISAYKKGKKKKLGGNGNPKSGKATPHPNTCVRFGKDYHTLAQCPAKKNTCKKCNKKGHWEKLCFTNKTSTEPTATT